MDGARSIGWPGVEPQATAAPEGAGQPAGRPRLARIGFRLGALLFGLFVAAAIGEAALRLLQPPGLGISDNEREFFCRFDPLLGWRPIENVTGIHAPHGRRALVHQNALGLRGPDDMKLERSDGRRRVLVLGDSYVWGFGVDQSRIFSAPEVHRTGQEILNLGVSGYGTDQEYLLYRERGALLQVDQVVLALTPYNDIANNLAPRQYGYDKPFFTLEGGTLVLHADHIRDRAGRNVRTALLRHSRLYAFLVGGIRNLRYRIEQPQDATDAAEAKAAARSAAEITSRDREGVALTVAILKNLKEAVTAQGAKFTVLFIPYKPHIDRRLPDNHPLVPLIAEGLTRAGIDYLEPYAEFLAADVAGRKVFHEPDNHFGPEGHALFAELLTTMDTRDWGRNRHAPR